MPKKRAQSPPPPAAEDGAGEAGPSEIVKEPTPPVVVTYCAGLFSPSNRRTWRWFIFIVCTFPLEYCEFGSSFTKCKEWLKEEDEDLYNRFYSEGTTNLCSHLDMFITKVTLYRGITGQDWYSELGGAV